MDKITLDNVKEMIVTSNEVLLILDIKRARLSQLARKGKLVPIKKNLYLLEDVKNRKNDQERLRKLYYRPKIK